MAIFVSHSVNDVESPVFGLLRGDLERMRYSVWFDQKLIGGQSWWDEILDQIRRCDLLVFAFSRHAIKSEACLAELGYALALHRPVLPVKLTELSDWEIPQSIARVQIIDYTARSQPGEPSIECIWALKDATDEILAQPIQALPEPLPRSPDVPLSYLLRLREIVNAAELTYSQQEQVIREVKARLVDVDIEERRSLAKILERFRNRLDIAVTVAQEVDGVLENLLLSPELTPPPTLKSWNVQPRQTMKAYLDRLPNRGQKAPTLRLPAAQLNLPKDG